MPVDRIEDKTFLGLLIAVSVFFAWILWPFAGAILWATIAAILFAPLNRRLTAAMRQRQTLAALVTLMIIVVMVIFPLTLITASLVEETANVYARIQSGEIDFGRYFRQIVEALPPWADDLLDRSGLTTLGALQERLSTGLMRTSQFLATQAVGIGQSTFEFIVSLFVMLYLLFFLLRDGEALSRRINDAIPLRAEQQRQLADRFAVVIRATIKGSLVVAILQGALGGLMFWLLGIRAPMLWGVLMAVLSLLPAVGPALVWLPVALYLFVTGSVWQAIVLVVYGVLVVGLVDNVVRPLMVGTATRIPDYIVLISTLGGIAIFGVNGFVIGPLVAAIFIAAWDIFTASRPTSPIERP